MASMLVDNRCFNHATREAVARCPECRRFFCRECVTEHGNRVLCSGCLARLAAGVAPRRGSGWAWLAHLVPAFIGCGLTVLFFYAFGRFLLHMPASYHEGTLWRHTWERITGR